MFTGKSLSIVATAAACIIVTSTAHAAPIIDESFDYGGASGNLADVSSWTSSSTFNDYVHDGGLDHPAMNEETGGAWFADRPGGNLGASLGTTTLDLSTLGAGDTVWAAALFDYKTGGGSDHYVNFSGGSVSGLGFRIKAGGDVHVTASNNGSATIANDTGIDVTSDGVYLMLLRATKGTGSSPTNSVVDFWLDPADASSVTALGAADWSTGADSKWGRSSQTMSGIGGLVSQAGKTDEIRFGTDLVDVIGVPEPASMALLGLGGLMILRRRG
jgi:hypothetical protein